MHTYYVSFSYQAPTGFAVGSLDVTTTDLIRAVTDLDDLYTQLAQQGYHHHVKILAFSLYAPTTAKAAPRAATPTPRQPNTPQPNSTQRNARSRDRNPRSSRTDYPKPQWT